MLSLRRDDVTTTRTAVRITYFNPRLHEGGDGTKRRQLVAICKISIHASAKEATVSVVPSALITDISIHASAKEATRGKKGQKWFLKFQSTPPRRRRHHLLVAVVLFLHISIHASAKEATVLILAAHFVTFYFNPRLREGGDLRQPESLTAREFQSTPPRRRRQMCNSLVTAI